MGSRGGPPSHPHPGQGPPLNRALLWVRGLGMAKRLRGAPTRALLFALASRVDSTLVAWPSERTLADDAGCSYSQVRVLLPQLVKCGALRVAEPQRGTRPARYQFTLCAYAGLPAKLEPRPDRKPKLSEAEREAERARMWAEVRGGRSAPPGGAANGASAPPGGAPPSAPPGEPSAPPGEPSAPPGGAEVSRSNQEAPPTGGALPGGECGERGDSAGKPAAAQGRVDNHRPPPLPIQSPLVAQINGPAPPPEAEAARSAAVPEGVAAQ